MFDYRLMEALAAVLEEKGFERAADRLGLTQSAVSQRVRQLESELGSILVIRENPPRPTAAGARLLMHYRQVAELERAACAELGREDDKRHLPIAVNTDSLAVWLLDALVPFLRESGATVEVLVGEQETTLGYLRSGRVVGCVSAIAAPVQGCRVRPLATMRYRLVAGPAFSARYFPHGLDEAAARAAPVVHSDRDDRLQDRAVAAALRTREGGRNPSARPPESTDGLDAAPGKKPRETEARPSASPTLAAPAHFIPSPEKYLELILAGLAYGLVAERQALPLLREGSLVELDEGARIAVPLFWHSWDRSSPLLDGLERALTAAGSRLGN